MRGEGKPAEKSGVTLPEEAPRGGLSSIPVT